MFQVRTKGSVDWVFAFRNASTNESARLAPSFAAPVRSISMKQTYRLRMIGAAGAAMLAGCAPWAPPFCQAGLKPMVQAELFFGRAIPGGGQIGDDDWRRFLDEEITPRFPEGFTVQDAAGQWKDKNGIVREPSKRITLVLSGTAEEQAKLEAIRAAYKKRFHQEAVLLLENKVCGAF